MKKAIVLAVVVSLIFWLLTFHFFFAYNRLAISLVAVAAGVLITFLVLRAFIKPGEVSPGPAPQLLVPLIVTGVVMFGVSMLMQGFCPEIAKPEILCNPARVVPNEICVKKNGKIEWYTDQIPDGARVRIDGFKKQTMWGDDPDQPLDKPKYEAIKGEVIKAKVRDDKDGYFKYSITCIPATGAPETTDPMIEVPPRGR